MRALVVHKFGAPPVIDEVPPPTCGPQDILVENHAAGLNFADVLMASGTYQMAPVPPFTLGFESAGEVVAIGSEVTDTAIGDRVMAFEYGGAFAEQRAVPAALTYSIPESMSYTEAAGFFIPYMTAYHGVVRRGALQPGERLLVLGASGGVGQAAVGIGKALGAEVIAAVSSDEKHAAALALGADHVIRYDRDSLSEEVNALTDARGVDVIFDPVGGEAFRDTVRCLAFLGRLVIIGFASGVVPSVGMNVALVKGISLLGADAARFMRERPDLAREDHDALVTLWQQGSLPDITTRVVSFVQAESIHGAFADRRVIGKWVLEI